MLWVFMSHWREVELGLFCSSRYVSILSCQKTRRSMFCALLFEPFFGPYSVNLPYCSGVSDPAQVIIRPRGIWISTDPAN